MYYLRYFSTIAIASAKEIYVIYFFIISSNTPSKFVLIIPSSVALSGLVLSAVEGVEGAEWDRFSINSSGISMINREGGLETRSPK